MPDDAVLTVHNGQAFAARRQCPSARRTVSQRRHRRRRRRRRGWPRCSPARRRTAAVRLTAVAARADADGTLQVAGGRRGRRVPALTPDCPQAHWFEREIASSAGVRARRTSLAEADPVSSRRAGTGDSATPRRRSPPPAAASPISSRWTATRSTKWRSGRCMPGSSSRAISASSATARRSITWRSRWAISTAASSGRWSAAPTARTIHYIETLAGDTTDRPRASPTAGRSSRCPQTRVPPRAQVIRGDRRWSWNGSPTTSAIWGPWPATWASCRRMSYCGRIRGDVLNLTALLCGNRFGRGLVRPGGVAFDLDARAGRSELQRRLEAIGRDARVGRRTAVGQPSVMAPVRGDGHGRRADVLSRSDWSASRPGPAAWPRDVRHDFPYGIYRFAQIPVSTWHTGDVFARAYVRWLEIQRSLAFVREQLESLPDGPICRAARAARGRTTWWWRWSKAGGARSAMSSRPTAGGRWRTTRSSTRRSTTGSAWPWRCGTSRSPISRCATRVSTFLLRT